MKRKFPSWRRILRIVQREQDVAHPEGHAVQQDGGHGGIRGLCGQQGRQLPARMTSIGIIRIVPDCAFAAHFIPDRILECLGNQRQAYGSLRPVLVYSASGQVHCRLRSP